MNSNLPIDDNHSSSVELGAILRAKRERLGLTLEAVAADLKIRNFYLKAIEGGQLSHLPGSAYVAGFIRVYSDYLGLDSEEMVRRFKLAGAAISNKTDLELPSPVEDGRLPSVFVFLVGALILVGAYGGWYLISVDRTKVVQSVVEPPQRMLTGNKSPEIKQGRSVKPVRATKPGPVLYEGNRVLPNKTENAASENLDKNQVVPSPLLSVGASTRLQKHESLATRKKTVLAPLAKVNPVSVSNLSKEIRVLPNKIHRTKPQNPLEKQEIPNQILSAPASRASRTAMIRGDQDLMAGEETGKLNPYTADHTSTASASIVVQATADSFIAVRTAENKLLFSQLMRPGDRYEVPSGANLILDTGNAGGLAISIGNKSAPALGFQGQIRRNILLNAINLLQGAN